MKYFQALFIILIPFWVSAQLDVKIWPITPSQICQTATTMLRTQTVLGTPTSYQWTSAIATFDNDTVASPMVSFLQSGNGSIILKVQDSATTIYDTIYVK